MKKLAIAALAVLCAAALIPQTLEAGVGIKAGYSLSKFSQASAGPLPFAWENLPFFVGGLSFEGGLGFISIQPEVLYVRMGGKFAAGELEFRFGYVQVPVLIKLNVVPAGPVRPFIAGGGYGAYLIKAEGVLAGTKADMTEDYQRTDYGVIGGAGLAFKLPGISVSVEGRYNYGLMNIMKDPAAGDSMKNRSLMALVGLSF
jgi:hypothetical protein